MNLPRSDSLLVSFCMTLIAICRSTAPRLCGPLPNRVPVLILAHHNIQAASAAGFRHPNASGATSRKRSDDKRRADQIMRRLGRRLGGGFPDAFHFADGNQARPLMILLQPVDIG